MGGQGRMDDWYKIIVEMKLVVGVKRVGMKRMVVGQIGGWG